MATSLISFDTRPLTALSARIGRLTPAAIGAIEVKAVNVVQQRAYDKARAQMIAGINLPDSYLRERMAVLPATDPTNPVAYIRAPYVHTLLSRYNARQLVAPGRTAGKGNAARGIAPGLKGAGVSVEVTRGSPKVIASAYLVPLRNGNGLGVFVRDKGSKKPRILYGPSVYQLFRYQIGVLGDEIGDDLQTTVGNALSEFATEVFG